MVLGGSEANESPSIGLNKGLIKYRHDSSKPDYLVYRDLISKSQESGTRLARNSTHPLQWLYLLTMSWKTILRKALARMTGAIMIATLKMAKLGQDGPHSPVKLPVCLGPW